ncbi:Cellulose biosynthesis protein BcsQ [Geoalkalibacter ferrihydriticus]|uniref:Cobyrinic acid a,c-diamide synthase n=2 Tax=Geoalkalibacter ferrihydriticus TaxID=392333 RepID=A0A0C2HWA3_9BACT|nr:AAA family ATPase [Geoalkalibacter ferrihydriticus]KIH77062.1 cobyrinic acid a,c-diamide synthase [Geoalkalibacter ferrihydriticus DSM 17813]SDL36700.1 Cellulose biosynthesis protein BcsQ [Geoalkalibacter ferrihydriticus]
MRVLATYNIKGGVGKTAAAVNLAWLAAKSGRRTLVWDLDPQGAATYYFRIKPKVKGGGEGLVSGRRNLDDLIKATDFPYLDLLPADFSYRSLDLLLDQEKKPTRRLRKVLKPLSGQYDVIFLDCPPSISLVSEAVFIAADALLVPVIPTTLSLRTLEQLYAFRVRQELDDLAVLPFFSMVDRRKGLHRQIVAELPGQWPDLLTAAIPYASEVERMGVEKAPLGSFAGCCAAALAFEDLWDDILKRLSIGKFYEF